MQPDWDFCHECGWDPEKDAELGALPPPPGGRSEASLPPIPGVDDGDDEGAVKTKKKSAVEDRPWLPILGICFFFAVAILAITAWEGRPEEDSPEEAAAKARDLRPPTIEPLPDTPEFRSWDKLTAPDGSFSVEMPDRPALDVGQQTVNGTAVPTTEYVVKRGQDEFSLEVMQAPVLQGIDPAKIVAARFANPSVPGGAAPTIESVPVTFAGHPAAQFKVNDNGKALVGRSIVIGDKAYTLAVTSAAVKLPEITRFLDSLSFNTKAPSTSSPSP